MLSDAYAAVLTLYKRDNLDSQLKSLLNQTMRPARIVIVTNENHVNPRVGHDTVAALRHHAIPVDQAAFPTWNTKFHGRFAVALLLETDRVLLLDDDTLPCNRWVENCHRLVSSDDCIVTANGRTLRGNTDDGPSYGDGRFVEEDVEVDFGGHSWFMSTKRLCDMWSFSPVTFSNGEDIHLSAASQIVSGTKTVVPVQPSSDTTLWGDSNNSLGLDQHATWRTGDHIMMRRSVIEEWKRRGWKPLEERGG